MKTPLWLVWVVGTILCWGCYVPMLHEGQRLLGGGKPPAGGLRAFLCVGAAYFLVAVVLPVILLAFGQEETSFSRTGTIYATASGLLGAAGALGIILAFKAGGKPLYIPSLIFCGAPIVNVLVTMAFFQPPGSPRPKPVFYLGFILAAVGAGLVLYGRPMPAKGHAASSAPAMTPADASEPHPAGPQTTG